MQEEIENRSITLMISATKLTLRTLKDAVNKYLAVQRARSRDAPAKDTVKHGKQTVKQLIGQGRGVTNIEITDSNIKPFERIARKYGVDFAIKKDASQSPPKWLVFFKAPDMDAMTQAFKEFTAKTMMQGKKPSILAKLRKFQQQVRDAVMDKAHHRSKEQTR